MNTRKPIAVAAAAAVLTGLLAVGGGTIASAATPQAASVGAMASSRQAATPRILVQDSGNNQQVETGHAFAQLIARAIDGTGNGVSGVPITFTNQPPTATDPGTASWPDGAQSITVVTDADGYAVANGLTAGTIGNLTIEASTPGLASAAFPETVAAPLPMAVFISGDGQTTGTGLPFAKPVVALVTDQYGTPLPNWPVTIKLVKSDYENATATFPGGQSTVNVTTDANGRLTSPPITAGGAIGSVLIEVCPSSTSCAVSDLFVINQTIG